MKRFFLATVLLCGSMQCMDEELLLRGARGPIRLETCLLGSLDGRFIKVDDIELVHWFRTQVALIQIGHRNQSGQIVGRYEWRGARYGAQDLCRKEEELEAARTTMVPGEYQQQWSELQQLMCRAKDDFLEVSKRVRGATRGRKEITAKLIEESCRRRGRLSSLLMTWARASSAEEDYVVERHVTTFGQLEQFCIDLFNFLSDFVHSCPRASKKFHERQDKWKKVCGLMPADTAQQLGSRVASFRIYLKQHHLDKLTLGAITRDKVRALIGEFTRTRGEIIDN